MRAECGACGYSVSHLKVGDARHDIAACSICRKIVNAVYFPFRPLEPICCPTCHSELPSRPELKSYLSCLAERFEAIGGKLFHKGDWQPARLVQTPDAFELRALDGSCLDRLNLPSK